MHMEKFKSLPLYIFQRHVTSYCILLIITDQSDEASLVFNVTTRLSFHSDLWGNIQCRDAMSRENELGEFMR